MRFLLAGILILLPFNAQGEMPSPPSSEECDSELHPKHADSLDVENADAPADSWPYQNPYSPISPTNFAAFTVPLVQRPEVNDRSRLSMHLYHSGPINSVYGHFGNPFFPDSINSRGTTDHPFAMDSSTNLYGRNWQVGGR